MVDQKEISRSSLYYQRLLALDQNEARQVLEQYLKDKPLTELYSEVLIPAMSLVEQDRHRNELDEATQSFIMQSTRELIEELDELPVEDTPTLGESLPIPRPLDVLCIPARDEADEIVALLLFQLLQRSGVNSQILPLGPAAETLGLLLLTCRSSDRLHFGYRLLRLITQDFFIKNSGPNHQSWILSFASGTSRGTSRKLLDD